MTKYGKILFLSVIAVGLLAGPAMAAVLYNSAANPFGTGGSTANSYKIAYEIYNEALGVSTIAGRGGIQIDLTQPLNPGDSANLVISSGNAVFNSAGSNYKWGLWLDVNADNLIDAGEIIGYTPSAGLTTNNLPFSINLAVVPPATLRVIQWEDSDANNDFTALEAEVRGAGIYVNPGLGATCDNTVLIKAGFTTPRETTPSPANFAYITPQFSGTAPSRDTLTAELDTDTDFRLFIEGSGPFVLDQDEIDNKTFLSIANNATTPLWIAFAEISPVGRVQFDVNSVVGQPAATIEFYSFDEFGATIWDGCSSNVAETSFNCDLSGVSLVNNHELYLYVDGINSNEPTNWSLTNVSINVTSAGLKDLCIVVPQSSIGVWYGGLEAFVPFVKGSADASYATYIVLYNRYDNDAKIYVSTFKDAAVTGGEPIMVSTGQIVGKEFIPADSKLVITDADIKAFLAANGITWDAAEGIPVKFNIRVPSQAGTTSFSGAYGAGSLSGSITGVNPFDPFVEGIVVSTYPGGQRSIPLKFKTFKQGQYGH